MHAHAHAPSIHPFSGDADFDYEIRCAIGRSASGAGDPGEILAAVSQVRKRDHEGWYAAWNGLGARSLATAEAAAAGGHRISAAGAYLRATAYFGTAVSAASGLPDSSPLSDTFARQREAWQGFIEHSPTAVESVEIPYEERTLPGWHFVPAEPNGATLVAVNGSDGSWASVWASCVHGALQRGYSVLMFDGPGQQSELFEDRSVFRADWEHVLTPIYDYLVTNRGADPERVAVYGISQGGFWVARAIAFEHRFAAAITDPGVVDVSTSWTSHLPASMLALLDGGQTKKFDREMSFGLKFSPDSAHTWQFRARPYGTTGYGETIDAVRSYTVADVASQITTPVLVLSPENEQFWPGQSEQLAELAGDVATLVSFTAAEGADGHCEPLAPALTAQRVFDWLDEKLATEVR